MLDAQALKLSANSSLSLIFGQNGVSSQEYLMPHHLTLLAVKHENAGFLVVTSSSENINSIQVMNAWTELFKKRTQTLQTGAVVNALWSEIFSDKIPENLLFANRLMKGGQVACGFIPDSAPMLKAASLHGEYFSVNPHEIPVEVPLPFDVFIHMPVNGRFIRLVKAGKVLRAEFRDRLILEGHARLFLSMGQMNEVQQFYVINRLKGRLK